MICIVQLGEESLNTTMQPQGWFTATDLDDARRIAESRGFHDIAQKLYQMFEVQQGRHLLDARENVWMLVD